MKEQEEEYMMTLGMKRKIKEANREEERIYSQGAVKRWP
jgi:hypothetical protein